MQAKTDFDIVVVGGGIVGLAAAYKIAQSHREVRIGAGEAMLLFTDGVTEAFNSADEEYGEARLQALLEKNRDLPREKFIQNLIGDACSSANRPGRATT
jgi:sigma-B regulation protein RsbU (phosphoserine phosphatase)